MSLRSRLFLLLGSILVLLGTAQWWLVRTLTTDLSEELASVASKVGNEVAGVALKLQSEEAMGARHPADVRKLIEASELPPEVKAMILSGTPPPPGIHEEFHVTTRQSSPEPHQPRVIVKSLKVETVGGDPSQGQAPDSVPGKRGDRVLFLSGPKTATWIPIDQEGIRRAVGQFQGRLLAGSVLILGLGFLASAFVADRMASPVRALALAARKVEAGDVGLQIQTPASGEAREAVDAFNRMSSRLAELERQALAMKEREHLSELGEVARGLAHALRNPLHALGLSVDQLASRAGEEAETEDLRATARRQIRNLDSSIRSFLAFASGGDNIEETVDCVTLSQDVVLSAIQDARGRVSLKIEAPARPLELTAVPAEIRAALQALVENAIDASPDAATVEVAVTGESPGRIRFTVSDRGPGLPDEIRARLFTPHLTTKPHGSGMGLFLTHRLAVTRYAGSLTLAEREGGGTTATLEVADRTGGQNG